MKKVNSRINKDKIAYLGYYDVPENIDEKRNASPAAVTMMQYTSSCLAHLGYDVKIISPAQTTTTRYYGKKAIYQNNGIEILFLPTFYHKNIIMRVINRLFRNLNLLINLLQLNNKSTLMVYHSLAYINVVKLAKKIKGFKMILQVCEVYADVIGSEKKQKKEMNWFKQASGYIFSNEYLEATINKGVKPFCICYGTYSIEEDRNTKFADGKIHVVYAGTFDPRKGGAAAAAAAAEFLDGNYHVHIIGFGSNDEIKNIKKTIDDVSKISESIVTYDGLKTGEEYIRFLQACDIGLSTQNPDADFNETSFPSKILSYLSNGLKVVSIRIPAIERSAIGHNIFYYDNQTPEEIAKAIQYAAEFPQKTDSHAVIFRLNEDFIANIKNTIEKL